MREAQDDEYLDHTLWFEPCRGSCGGDARTAIDGLGYGELNQGEKVRMLCMEFRVSQCEREKLWGTLSVAIFVGLVAHCRAF